MGWSDDDWDADDVDKKLEASQAKKAKDWDSSSDEEKKPEEEEKPKPKAEPKPEPKAKATGKKGKKKFTPMNLAAEETKPDVPLADPVEEKKRKQKLVEDADARLAADLFSDCPPPASKKETAKEVSNSAVVGSSSDLPVKIQYVTKDSFEELQLNVQKDVEVLSSRCCQKIMKSATLKAGAAHKFVFDLFKALEPELGVSELNELDKFVAQVLKEKKVNKTAVEANKKKGNEKLSKTTKFNVKDEMSTVYGEGEWDEEDWDGYEDY